MKYEILAPVLKKLGIIEQWGNGLKLIAEELQYYPEIGLDWKEPGITFRVTFTNKNFKQQQELQQELKQELQQELRQELQHESLYGKILRINTKENFIHKRTLCSIRTKNSFYYLQLIKDCKTI